ncbi:hypothetical protein [Chryseosolibacter indicus]|uniref:Lipoprotein n=1 Tax=Chryseosolibacter indicus TaxID=2782351 RepID=A0ABS5VUE0_9BACT|nr:hypothetical protein [Chryseosolibacter indicus]MBT1704374.1 hypothetical protein [Chryseosolibacter indicus]
MRTSLIFIALMCSLLLSCNNSFDAKDNLTNEEYEEVLMKVAPYVIKKSDDFSYEDRFKPENASYYQRFIEKSKGELKYFKKTDTASIFFFSYKDLSSLYEHYQGLGGYYRTDDKGKITFLNILYHTPRFTKEEQREKDQILFEEMVSKGNVNAYIGNRKFIHTPNKDFYYNTKLNKWDYTPNSSWKFLNEAKQEALKADSVK